MPILSKIPYNTCLSITEALFGLKKNNFINILYLILLIYGFQYPNDIENGMDDADTRLECRLV